MFKITLSEIELLKSTIPAIAEIIDEGVFRIDNSGFALLAPDRAMVAVVDFKILPTAFQSWSVEQPTELGLNLAHLTTVLKRAKSGDSICIEPGRGKLKISIEGSSVRTFEIPILDIKAEKPPIEQLKFAGQVELDSSILDESIADAEIVADSIFIEGGPDIFRLSAKGELKSLKIEFRPGQSGLLSLNTKLPIKSQYALDYLKKMAKIAKIVPQVCLEWGTDYPLRLTFTIIDKMRLAFILAPRVSE
jgi:proliferating cell nuclear antigen